MGIRDDVYEDNYKKCEIGGKFDHRSRACHAVRRNRGLPKVFGEEEEVKG
jgi:hypothetical protein